MRSPNDSEWAQALTLLAEWWDRPEAQALKGYLSHRLALRQRTHLSHNPDDAVGIARHQGYEQALEEILDPKFLKDVQEHARKQCQTKS